MTVPFFWRDLLLLLLPTSVAAETAEIYNSNLGSWQIELSRDDEEDDVEHDELHRNHTPVVFLPERPGESASPDPGLMHEIAV